MKKSWDTIFELIGKKKDKSNIPDHFIKNGNSVIGDKNIANGFNNFFSTIGSELATKIPNSNKTFSHYIDKSVSQNFTFCKVTPKLIEETAKMLKSKSSHGDDLISPKLLKKCLPHISKTLSHLFNLSFNTGYIAPQMKLAKVVPIFKSGDNKDFNNYRPISLLSSFAKLQEKIVAKQITGFLYKHKVLYENQFGFRKGHNTFHPIFKFLDNIFDSLNKPDPEFCLGIFLYL